jgi:hypothetical protein
MYTDYPANLKVWTLSKSLEVSMDVGVQVTVDWSAQKEVLLRSAGINFEVTTIMSSPYIRVRDRESNPGWPRFDTSREVVHRYAIFDDSEMAAAEWFWMSTGYIGAYLRPNDFRKFSDGKGCDICCDGFTQVMPFSVDKKISVAKKPFVCLHGDYSVIITSETNHARFFEPLGLSAWPVLHAKKPIEGVVQLRVEERVSLDVSDAAACPACARPKPIAPLVDFCPPLFSVPSSKVVVTEQAFGEGQIAMHLLVVHASVRTELLNAGFTTLRFHPFRA